MSEDNSENVIHLKDVQPKVLRVRHNQVPITIKYVSGKGYVWEIEVVTRTKFNQVAKSQEKALIEAKKYIDKNNIGV
jgi:hypothetical protein